MKLLYTGPVVNAEMLVVMLEKHGIAATQEFVEPDLPDDADLSTGRLSVLSPLGTALLGARVGDVVSVVGAAGVRRIKIEAILHQPEAQQRGQPCGAISEEVS